MSKIVGLGGLFVKSINPKELIAWYKNVLGLSFDDWGGMTLNPLEMPPKSYQVFSTFPNDTKYIPVNQSYMINFMVDDLNDFVRKLKEKGVEIMGQEESEYGKFAWIHDIDNNKIELWQMP